MDKFKEIILCKYGEIVLKGANRSYFEDMLCRDIRRRAKAFGNFEVYRAQSTVYIEPKEEAADLDGMFESARRVFGIAALNRAAVCPKDIESISALARTYVPDFLEGKGSFKVESKRSDKRFPLNSAEISAKIGGDILSVCDWIHVDVHNPEVVVRVEVREFGAYVHAAQAPGAGGMPAGSGGAGMLLLSGGIDSPVAGWMMAKRGVRLEAVHFESYPYTSELARDKVISLAGIVAGWAGEINLHIVSLTHIQEEIRRACDEDYSTLLLRRYMMSIADRLARARGCGALITGESLAQVASQTMQAIAVTDAAAGMPVYRPCIGLDKEEIVSLARKVGSFDTSIQPYEDCCTIFTPRHPKTRPELSRVLAEEGKLDFEGLVAEALAGVNTVRVSGGF